MITPSFNLTATERVLPNLALDFTTASLDGRITFTRSGATSTVVNSSGLIEVVGVDTPRFDYDPVTLACKGLLIEESRTNLKTYSESFGDATGWNTKSNASISADATTSPDGNTTADKLVEGTGTATQHYVASTNQVSVTSGSTYTLSVFAKAAERSWIRFYSDAALPFGGAYFDIGNGAVGTVSSGNTASIEDYGGGWYRCIITATATSTGAAYFAVRLATANGVQTYDGDGSSGAYLWGAQLEAGAFATSYIPTTTAQVTRTADVATMTGTNFSDWFNASEGTFETQVVCPKITGLNMRYLQINDGSNVNRIELFGAAASTGYVNVSSVNQVNISSGSFESADIRNTVFGYKTNDFSLSAGGLAPTTDSTGLIPTVDRMFIGSSFASSSSYLNGWMQKIYYWPLRLQNSEIQAFSKG